MTDAQDPAAWRLSLAKMSASEVLTALASRSAGLSPAQAQARLAQHGKNELPKRRQTRLGRAFLGQFTHFFALTLWISAALAFVGDMPELGWAIVIVVVVNGVFSFVQEYRAERATRALEALLPASALVRRAGEERAVSVSELVPGDLLVLKEGARISADARLLRAEALYVDNSTLTGESEPVARTAEIAPPEVADDLSCENLVFAGSWVVSGSAVAVVVATGTSTRLGAISQLTGRVERRPTPLHASLNRAVRVIGAIALSAGGLFVAASLALGMPLHQALLFSVGVIVALVPEGLLPTLTLSLALGATRMARRGALVRHLEAVETLGSTTVICTDKTGTLTENEMTVVSAFTLAGPLEVTGTGYNPRGAILAQGRPLSEPARRALEPLFLTAALCGDARVERRDGAYRCLGDPTEGALLVFAHKGGVRREDAERAAHRVQTFPFNAQRKRMTTVHALASGAHLVLTKGAVETVLPLCNALRVGTERRALMHDDRARIEREVEALAASGLRVLALAHKEQQLEGPVAVQDAESDLEFLGLAAMHDPVRAEVPAAIAQCQGAGIRVIVVTGDHPATARAVAERIGLHGRVVLGQDLPASQDALADLLAQPVAVLARVSPEQKLAIALALQTRGNVVAMTGDGVNDAPALRQADIGVAMGVGGTDVAREAADLVLLDDNFANIAQAVEEGRAAFANIRRFLTYHLTDNTAELAPFLVWALTGGAFPLVLSVLQILALDIGTDLLPALALGAEPPEPEVMKQPPRSREVSLLDRKVLARVFGFLGLVQAALSLSFVPLGAALFLGWSPGEPLPTDAASIALVSTLVFASIVLMQAVNAFECRTTPASMFSRGLFTNRLLVGAVVTELAVLMLFVYAPPLQRLLGHVPLKPVHWTWLALAPLLLLAAEELRKLLIRRVVRRRALRRSAAPSQPPLGPGWRRTARAHRAR